MCKATFELLIYQFQQPIWKQFLDYFNMTALNELPTLEEIKHLEGAIDSTKQPMQVMSEQQDTAKWIKDENKQVA